jgi:hypothetical protein
VIGNKISSFFLILVLLLSVTNLPTFSATQLNTNSNNLNGLSIGMIGIAFADDDDDEDEDDDDDNGKDKKEKKEKKEKYEKKGSKQEIKVEIEDGEAEVEIKINDIESELELDTNDLDEILTLIQTITGLSESEIKDIWEVKIENDDDDEEEDNHGKKDKISICHIPPGNPNNAHTINVSGNAKYAHLAHGDTLGECPDKDDDIPDDDQDNPTTITLTKQVTNDNQGTAGPDDFKISVNGTIVLSGSTTEVAPNVLFAINETVADGYEFVEITGDPECPTNLDAKTISLAPGQDINCTIHNNDVGQTSSSSFQTSESTSDNDELSQLTEENKKLREDLERQGEQMDDLNEEVDYLRGIIESIQGFFGSIFG